MIELEAIKSMQRKNTTKKNSRFSLLTVLYLALGIVLMFALSIIVVLIRDNSNLAKPDDNLPSIFSGDPIEFSGNAIRLIWFYKPPNEGDINTLSQHFDTFILTKRDEDTLQALKSIGVTSPIMQYLHFNAIRDPGSCEEEYAYGNTVAYNAGDFCIISEKHPDWFLLDTNGNRIYDGEYTYMDPANSEWRSFWLERAMYTQENLGWEGVFLDNVEASLSKLENLERVPANYPNNRSYQNAVLGFLQFISINYFQPNQRPLMANIIALEDEEIWFSYLQFLDGAMEEGWAIDWSDGYRNAEDWEFDLQIAEETQRRGKTMISVAQGDYGNWDRQEFAFASYLLSSYGKSVFRYADADAYNQIWLYPNYEINIGEPLGPRYIEGNFWRRDFSNGYVLVDPINHTATISLTE